MAQAPHLQGNTSLLCDPVTGACEIPAARNADNTGHNTNPSGPFRIIYFTDPICSSCWGIEPQLRKLKLEYGHAVIVEYRMGGLLPNWSYNSGGISKPSDVAHHWDEVSLHYKMPIDGDVWLEDPLSSSFPPSIAFKAAQMQDKQKAIDFLRHMREMVFLQKKNITKWKHLSGAARHADLDTNQLKADIDGSAKAAFETDLALAQQLGVRGFPTLFFIDGAGKSHTVYGTKPYSSYEDQIQKLWPELKQSVYAQDWASLFSEYRTLTAREYAELSGLPDAEAEARLRALADQGILKQADTKNGSIWMLE